MNAPARLYFTDLRQAEDGSFYTISGCGGDLQEWVDGYNGWLDEAGIGTPVECTCCAWRWDTQESYDDHVDYMATITDPLSCPTHLLGVSLPGLPHKSLLDATPVYRDLRSETRKP